MNEPSLFTLTPGARAARRGLIGSRPGQPDFAQMSMIDIGNALQRHPWLREMFGHDMEVKFLGGDGCLRIEVREAPPAS
jgi:hypothetical protein